jgi:hypothetical protein
MNNRKNIINILLGLFATAINKDIVIAAIIAIKNISPLQLSERV